MKRVAATKKCEKKAIEDKDVLHEYHERFAPVPRPVPGRGPRHNRKCSDKQLANALTKAGGFRSVAARMLKMAASTVYDRIKASPWLQKVEEEINEARLDFTEHKLFEQIAIGRIEAIKVHLQYKGQKRGYTLTPADEGKGENALEKLARMLYEGPRDKDTDDGSDIQEETGSLQKTDAMPKV